MAGGKLSPRQKMINMMYLVLTALLAMNVTKEILHAFETLSESLEASANDFNQRNKELAENIKFTIDEEVKEGNERNKKYKKVVTDIHQKALDMHGYMFKIIEDLHAEDIGGTDPETGKIKTFDQTESNYQYFMGNDDLSNGGHGNGKALELQKKLDEYVDWARKLYKEYADGKVDANAKIPSIALEPKDNPNIKDSEVKGKTWTYHMFKGQPVVANIATLQMFRNEIANVESTLLDLIKSKLGFVKYKIDSLIAVDAPLSRRIVKGSTFESKIYVVATSTEIIPKFSGAGVSVDEGGQTATIKIKGTRSGKNTYSATVRIPNATGKEDIREVKGEFEVIDPVLKVTSASVLNLYQECANYLDIDCPALGPDYNPSFSAQGGTAKKGKGTKVLVVPTAKKVKVFVTTSVNGVPIKFDPLIFNAVKPPKPSIAILKGANTQLNPNQPVPRTAKLKLAVVPDKDFRKALPKDARYGFASVAVKVKSGLGAPKTIATLGGGSSVTLNLAAWKNKIPPTAQSVMFEASSIYRTNFQGKNVPVHMTRTELFYKIILK